MATKLLFYVLPLTLVLRQGYQILIAQGFLGYFDSYFDPVLLVLPEHTFQRNGIGGLLANFISSAGLIVGKTNE